MRKNDTVRPPNATLNRERKFWIIVTCNYVHMKFGPAFFSPFLVTLLGGEPGSYKPTKSISVIHPSTPSSIHRHLQSMPFHEFHKQVFTSIQISQPYLTLMNLDGDLGSIVFVTSMLKLKKN